MAYQSQIQLQTTGKRHHASSNESSPSDDHTTNTQDLPVTDNWPRFLVMESQNSDQLLSKLSPFIVEKAMKGISDVVNVKKLRSGALLIEVSRPAQASNLLKQTTFAMIPVKVTPHRTMNTCKGVIRDRDLADMDTTELVDELKCVGVTDAKNIYQNRNGNKTKTAAVILTFAKSVLPRSINAGYTKIRVEPYIPNPLRCFTCQGYGHHQSTCKRNKICARCGQSNHGTEACTAAPHCANCSGDHPAYATSCPKWIKEKEICKTKVLYNVTFPEARKMVDPTSNESNSRITYSAMVRSATTTATVGTQTDIINCTCMPKSAQHQQINTVNKEKKQASNQTEDMEKPENKNAEETGSSSQQSKGSWNSTRKSRAHSLSSGTKADNRGPSVKMKSIEPPEKQFRGSQSPKKLINKTLNITDDGSLEAMAAYGHAGSQKPAQTTK